MILARFEVEQIVEGRIFHPANIIAQGMCDLARCPYLKETQMVDASRIGITLLHTNGRAIDLPALHAKPLPHPYAKHKDQEPKHILDEA